MRALDAAHRRLLPEGRLAGPMPWVIAVMAFLAALALVAGLSLAGMADGLGSGLSRRVTVAVTTADAPARDRQARAVLAAARAMPGAVARAVPAGELDALLAPWLGPRAGAALPLPALVDVTLPPGLSADRLAARLAGIAPDARIERHDAVLAPLAGLVAALRLLAATLVVLVAAAMAAVVVLAARGALDTHRGTVDVLHLLGAEDRAVARLFARRLALDALLGAGVGTAAAGLALVPLGRRLAALESGLATLAAPGPWGWTLPVLLPAATAGIALLAARTTVLAALGRTP